MIAPEAKFIIILNDAVILINSIDSGADLAVSKRMSQWVKGLMRSLKIHTTGHVT